MTRLTIPTVQHLARNWRDTPVKIEKVLVRLADNPPIFNYNPIYPAIEDMLIFGVPLAQVIEGIQRGTTREKLANNYIEILKLIHRHFEQISPDFVNTVSTRKYAIGRDILVPFTPPLIYGMGGQIHFPWFSFWRSQPLANERLSLFVTMVYDLLRQDPDLDGAKFEILDMSAPKGGEPRELKVIDTQTIPILNDRTKLEMLDVFAQGFNAAKTSLAARSSKTTKKSSSEHDTRQQTFEDKWSS